MTSALLQAPTRREVAYAVAATVRDPELPVLTLADLGVLRAVEVDHAGAVTVAITPTYSGCPAMASMRDDLVRTLQEHGFDNVSVKVVLTPAWSTDWISEQGRRALQEYGVSPPGPAPSRRTRGPIPLSLGPVRRSVSCPRCGTTATRLTSEFGATPCKALYRCEACLEPFEHVKEI